MLPKKKSKIPAIRFLHRSLLAQIFEKKVPNMKKKTEKINPGQMLGQDRPEKNSAKCSFEAARLRALDIHRSTQTRLMKSERGALVRGSDPPSGHSVHKTAGDTWRAPARRLNTNTFGRGCAETGDKKSRSLSDCRK